MVLWILKLFYYYKLKKIYVLSENFICPGPPPVSSCPCHPVTSAVTLAVATAVASAIALALPLQLPLLLYYLDCHS